MCEFEIFSRDLSLSIFSTRCRRLGLTTLCYLWQRNQADLLSEMIAVGVQSILIKVAGIGLTQSHLGKTLVQMQPTLVNLVSQFIRS